MENTLIRCPKCKEPVVLENLDLIKIGQQQIIKKIEIILDGFKK